MKAYLRPFFVGKTCETLYMLALDNAIRPIDCILISEGSVRSSDVDFRKITEHVLRTKASSVVLAHNHPRGQPIPSAEDIEVTKFAHKHLKALDVLLIDHLIFNDYDVLSFRESGYSFIDERPRR